MTPESHQQLLAALMNQLAAQHSGETPTLIQTHISSVILIGSDAYKIKRPVRFSFVDFSTLENRRFFCHEELRLNARTAPELYLEVLPVTGSQQGPQLGGQGPVLEWVLHMKRFPEEGVLSRQARLGRLTLEKMDLLAQHLAHFHSSLPELNESQLAQFSDMAGRVTDNLSELAPLLAAQKIDFFDFEALAQSLNRWAKACDVAMPQRKQQGFFRECHGDLHLANLVEIDGRLLAFDAIEFDPGLRCIDVINDLAFAFMDLLAFDQTEHAWRLVSSYLELTGDYEGLALLKGYAANRALIRAKVTLLSGGPASTAQTYLTLAAELLKTEHRPLLVLVGGLSGSGKSTFANFVAPMLGAVRIRSDRERKRLAARFQIRDKGAFYSQDMTSQTYAQLINIARISMKAGISVIVDATLTESKYVNDFLALSISSTCRFSMFECVASESIMRERLIERSRLGTDPSDATVDVLSRQLLTKDKQKQLPGLPVIQMVYNTGTLSDLEAQARVLIQPLRQNLMH